MEAAEVKELVLKGLKGLKGLESNPLLENEMGSHPDRIVFIEKVKFLAPKVYDKLIKGVWQAEDVAYYGTKQPADTEKAILIFEGGDTLSPGYCNVNNAKLEADRPFLLQYIMLEYSDAAAGAFIPAVAIPTLLNGEFEFKVNEATLIKSGMHLFSRPDEQGADNAKSKALIIKLRNPKWIEAQQPIEFNIKLKNGLANATNDHQVRISLLGTGVRSAVAQ